MKICNFHDAFHTGIIWSTRLVILLFVYLVVCCDKSKTNQPQEVAIVVGLYEQSLSNQECLYFGSEELDYFVNGKLVGIGNEGAVSMLRILKTIPRDSRVTIVNPATAFIAGESSRPGIRDTEYMYPYVSDLRTRTLVIEVLDEIRGWHDSTPPHEPAELLNGIHEIGK